MARIISNRFTPKSSRRVKNCKLATAGVPAGQSSLRENDLKQIELSCLETCCRSAQIELKKEQLIETKIRSDSNNNLDFELSRKSSVLLRKDAQPYRPHASESLAVFALQLWPFPVEVRLPGTESSKDEIR